ncbi:GNAT family N-acetyltransferase [Streptomyces avermitilis]|uniref:GNAT family N-acetyltransferase n=1 Tax=Streptomyces avermitilis TaxID=33903 RepID=UPI0033A943F3
MTDESTFRSTTVVMHPHKLCELAVTPAWQGRDIGTRLHATLLMAINSDWSSLLVRPDNTGGRTLYDRLGYRYADPYRNEPGGSVYDLLLLQVESG